MLYRRLTVGWISDGWCGCRCDANDDGDDDDDVQSGVCLVSSKQPVYQHQKCQMRNFYDYDCGRCDLLRLFVTG